MCGVKILTELNASEAAANVAVPIYSNGHGDYGGGTFNSFLLRSTIIWQTVLFHLNTISTSGSTLEFSSDAFQAVYKSSEN